MVSSFLSFIASIQRPRLSPSRYDGISYEDDFRRAAPWSNLEDTLESIYEDGATLFEWMQTISSMEFTVSESDRPPAMQRFYPAAVSVGRILHSLLDGGRSEEQISSPLSPKDSSLLREELPVQHSSTLNNADTNPSFDVEAKNSAADVVDVNARPTATSPVNDTSSIRSRLSDRARRLARAGRASQRRPWYLRSDTRDCDIVFDSDGKVKGGTINALVERLTAHDHSGQSL